MRRIYFDNAATTFPKPDCVLEAVYEYMKNNGMNVGRGAYSAAFLAAGAVYETRERLCRLFNFDKPSNVVFTANVTEALNIVIKGFLKEGDHVLVSSLEHNSVMRPLNQLVKKGVTFDRFECDNKGRLIIDESLIKENTKAVIMTHASNVFGTVMPFEEVGAVCKKHGLKFIADCAQSGGSLDVDMKKMNIDALCFTGHKGLFGPQGIGGFIITDEMADLVEPVISGGTGSVSDSEEIPAFLPDKFEAGTLNIPGIVGLGAGLKFIEETGIENIRKKEMELTEKFIDGVRDIDGFEVVGIDGIEGRTAVVSLKSKYDTAECAFNLDREAGIMTRVGMHCAPNAHKVMGTFPEGTIRFSFGYFNTIEEIEYALDALKFKS